MTASPAFHFNTLPLPTRQRLADILAGRGPCPLLMAQRVSHLQRTGTGLGGVVAGLAVVAGLLGTRGGELGAEAPLYDGWRLLGYGAGLVLLAGGALALAREIRAHRHRHACAAPDGTYVFPGRILDIRDGWITSRDLAALTRLAITDHSTNGLHTHTSFDFRFGEAFGAPWVQLRFGQRRDAAAALALWEAGREAFLTRVKTGKPTDDLDPFAGVPQGLGGLDIPIGPWVPEPMSPLLRPVAWRGLRLNLALMGMAATCGLLAWGIDSLTADAQAFREARRQDAPAGYRRYAERGLLHTAEVRSRYLPAALLREALASSQVQPLRAFLREFPAFQGAGKARLALDTLFDRAQARWLESGKDAEPKAVACLKALIQIMRQSEPEAVRVVFGRPEAKALEAMDQTLGAVRTTPTQHLLAALDRNAKRPVEALAPHFTPEACAQREDELVRQLQAGFTKVFQADLLMLKKGEAGQGPCLRIDYRIDPTDSRFSRSGSGVRYMGIRLTFDVRVELPGQAQALRFPLVVEPMDVFKVAYTRTTPARTPWSILKVPTGGEVYGAMASRALEQVREKLQQVFLGTTKTP
jgi:hypothetical protein